MKIPLWIPITFLGSYIFFVRDSRRLDKKKVKY